MATKRQNSQTRLRLLSPLRLKMPSLTPSFSQNIRRSRFRQEPQSCWLSPVWQVPAETSVLSELSLYAPTALLFHFVPLK